MNEEISVLNLQFKKSNSNEFDSLDEMGKFLEKYKIYKTDRRNG